MCYQCLTITDYRVVIIILERSKDFFVIMMPQRPIRLEIDKTLKTNLNTIVAKLFEAKHAVVSRVSRVRC